MVQQQQCKQRDQCSLFGGLNLALPYTPSHRPGVSVIYQNLWQAGHRGCSEKDLSSCSGGMKSPGEGEYNADE